MKVVSKNEFKELMCSAYFLRLSENQGSCRGEVYYCPNPPTIDELIDNINEALK